MSLLSCSIVFFFFQADEQEVPIPYPSFSPQFLPIPQKCKPQVGIDSKPKRPQVGSQVRMDQAGCDLVHVAESVYLLSLQSDHSTVAPLSVLSLDSPSVVPPFPHSSTRWRRVEGAWWPSCSSTNQQHSSLADNSDDCPHSSSANRLPRAWGRRGGSFARERGKEGERQRQRQASTWFVHRRPLVLVHHRHKHNLSLSVAPAPSLCHSLCYQQTPRADLSPSPSPSPSYLQAPGSSKASFLSPTPSFEADDEGTASDISDMEHDHGSGRHRAPQYPGEDTRLTSSKELFGWYSYAWAAEVFVVCGIGMRQLFPVSFSCNRLIFLF